MKEILTRDHERLDALLARAVGPDGRVDLDVFEEFRRGLLRHIGIEETILLPAIRRRDGETEVDRQLHRDHAALAALLVPSPACEEIETIRRILAEHNPLEEGDGGFYERVERLADAAELTQRAVAYPEVRTAPYSDTPHLRRSLEHLLREADEGRRRLRAARMHNLLEPPSLIRHFQAHPPEGFAPLDLGAPAFSARFDLLTTVDLPLARRARGMVRPRTCFVGTTVSEYALFPRDVAPEELVRGLVASAGREFPFVIVKDIPTDDALVGAEALAYSRRVAEACLSAGFVLVEGQALAYVPIDFASIDELTARMSHARRKNIRRKLRRRAELEVEAIATGDARFADESLLGMIYALYRNVYDQSEIHFDLLTPAFFRAVLQDANAGGVVFFYRAGDALIGWNLCLRANGMLIDKYIGLQYPAARDYDLYTVSWFHNLEYALATGARHYVAGWTDPEVKRQLGARFTLTRHAVHVRNRAMRALLRPLRRFFESDRRWHDDHVTTAGS